MRPMNEPTADEFAAYDRVKRYLRDQAAKRMYGYLKGNDSLFAPGELMVTVGGMGRFDFPWERYQEGYYDAAGICIENVEEEGGIDQTWTVSVVHAGIYSKT